MSRAIDIEFYNSPAWIKVRSAYKKQHPYCEVCIKQGRYNPTEIIHHKIYLTKKNYTNPEISLNPKNLLAVCRNCHNTIHKNKQEVRHIVGSNGEIIGVRD